MCTCWTIATFISMQNRVGTEILSLISSYIFLLPIQELMREMTKTEQFWSIGEMILGKEAGNLQKGRKKNACANRNGETQLPQEQKKDVHDEKHRGHVSGNLLKNQAFFFIKFSCVIIYGTAKENLDCGSDHKTGK